MVYLVMCDSVTRFTDTEVKVPTTTSSDAVGLINIVRREAPCAVSKNFLKLLYILLVGFHHRVWNLASFDIRYR